MIWIKFWPSTLEVDAAEYVTLTKCDKLQKISTPRSWGHAIFEELQARETNKKFDTRAKHVGQKQSMLLAAYF